MPRCKKKSNIARIRAYGTPTDFEVATMLIEKEIIRPGTYWYKDEQTGLPRKLVVTPELCKYWNEQGNAMLSAGLTVPVPCEHDFNAHPMTPADKLKNNGGWVKEYRMKDLDDGKGGKIKDVFFGVVDVTDPEIAKKLPHTIRWTSPWISSFTDGKGREWKNVITHLALTTRPRIIDQAPFSNVSTALSMAVEVKPEGTALPDSKDGFCLSRAGRIFEGKQSKRLQPRYPLAFSLWAGGVALAEYDKPPKKDDMPEEEHDRPKSKVKPKTNKDGEKPPEHGEGHEEYDEDEGEEGEEDYMNPLADATGDVKMEEMLCDLLQALGVPMPDESNEHEFKRHLYEATMSKIKELTCKHMQKEEEGEEDQFEPDQNKPPHQQPHASHANPLMGQIRQEQQPMFMSLEEINKIPDPTMKGIALSMYNENVKLRAEVDASAKTTASLRDAKLKEENDKRTQRVAMLGKLSPKVKTDLEAMLALPAMALSMGDGGVVIDPMAQTLAVLEKGLSELPKLLTTDSSLLSLQQQPKDADMLSEDKQNEIADGMARMMGAAPSKKAS